MGWFAGYLSNNGSIIQIYLPADELLSDFDVVEVDLVPAVLGTAHINIVHTFILFNVYKFIHHDMHQYHLLNLLTACILQKLGMPWCTSLHAEGLVYKKQSFYY